MMKTPHPKISKLTAEIVGWMDDLLKEIFVHLPLKPLISFKLVSKHWNSIISDTKLIFSRRNHNRAVGLIFQNEQPEKKLRLVSFDRLLSSNPPHQINIPETLTIFHSCNGLLVLKRASDLRIHDYYYVYNPTTHQMTTNLAREEKGWPTWERGGMYLAFDPSKSPNYKLVCVFELCNWIDTTRHYQFQVYSSETGSWETRGGGPHKMASYIDLDNDGVYWNGAIHWVGYSGGESMYFNPDDHWVSYFCNIVGAYKNFTLTNPDLSYNVNYV